MVKNLFFDAKIDCYNYDVIFPSERFDKIVKQRQNYCLFFESCNSPADLIKFIYLQFISILCMIFLQILTLVMVYLFSIKISLIL